MPNWLREEIIKKKEVIGTSAIEISMQDTKSNEVEVMEGSLGKGDQVDGKSMSTEEEDDVEVLFCKSIPLLFHPEKHCFIVFIYVTESLQE